ncbi:MAG: ABC transporter ATP-binding protein [Rhodoblastus sp.]
MTADKSIPLLDVRGLQKRFGGLVATDSVSLDVRPGEIHALIGPNGAGKSTLIAQLIGQLRHDGGEIHLAGQRIDQLAAPARVRRGLGRTFQITQLLPEFTALENVALAVQTHEGHSFRFLRAAASQESLNAPARRRLEEAGLSAKAHVKVAALSQGERKQLELAIALAGEPRLLLLDEPMAGLGPGESAAMVETLRALKGRIGMLLVEHDMDAVFALADRISVLVYGKIVASGDPAAIRDDPVVHAAYLGEGDA